MQSRHIHHKLLISLSLSLNKQGPLDYSMCSFRGNLLLCSFSFIHISLHQPFSCCPLLCCKLFSLSVYNNNYSTTVCPSWVRDRSSVAHSEVSPTSTLLKGFSQSIQIFKYNCHCNIIAHQRMHCLGDTNFATGLVIAACHCRGSL